MDPALLQTKLYIPQPRPALVPRQRLLTELMAGLHRKLTLVSAPAGFGKTTLVSNWLLEIGEGRRGGPAEPSMGTNHRLQSTWLSLEAADNDPPRFLAYLLAALEQADPALEPAFQSIRPAVQQVSLDNALPVVINALTTGHTKIILVLDDYHLIQNQVIHDGLNFLLDHLPPQLHLVLTGRADPPFSLARFRARGQITEIRTEDLRFSADEAALFLRRVTGLDLSAQDVTALDARTEGWIAGLQMAALSLQKRPDVSTFIRDFTGSHRYILDYLTDEVLRQRPPGTRAFLLKTSILGRLSGPLADAVTGQGQSQATLEQLEAANLFLIPLDDDRRWYRYHHLFADLLCQHLRREMPDQEPGLHRRASRWFEEAGHVNEAIEHALAAAEFERAAALIEPVAHGMAYRMETETLGRWVEALPEALLLHYPGIVFPYSIILSATSRFDEYRRYVEKTEQAALANIDKREAQIILGQVGVQKSIRLHMFGDYEQALAQVAETQAILRRYDQPDERWELISIVGYSTIHTRGEADAALTHLNRATRLGTADEGSVGALLCNTFAANAYFYLGRLHQAEAALQTALQAVTLPDGTRMFHAVFPSALLARLAYERNRLDEAARYVDAYLPLADITGFTTDPVDTIFVGTMLPLAQGDPDRAKAVLRQTEPQFQAFPIAPAFALRLAAIKALLWLRLGQLQTAVDWAGTVEIPADDDHLQPWLAFVYLVWARIQVARQNFAAADPLLARLRSWAAAEKLNGIMLETALVQACSAQAQQDQTTALTHLQSALSRAAPEGYTRLFLDEGEPMRHLLKLAVQHNLSPAYATALLADFEVPPDEVQQTTPSDPHPTAEPLSPRETEVLQLIAQGLTNKEIAAKLIIAPSTAKRHTVNIYNKLGINNRAEATARAYKLGLMGEG